MEVKAFGNFGPFARNTFTGAAWLSSARVVRCRLKCLNERNPHRLLYHSGEPASTMSERKVGTMSNHHSPYPLGYTHVTMANNNELRPREVKPISKISPQFRL